MTAMATGQHFGQGDGQASRGTLGDVLHADKSKNPSSEKEWVRLVQSIAGGDQLALHALYERTHRVVFTLMSRITRHQETAEGLTLDVFCDVWRGASRYDAEDGTVLGWIMNQARSRALDGARLEQPKKRIDARGQLLDESQDVLEFPQAASLQGRLALRIAADLDGEPLLPAKPPWLEPEWTDVAPGISCKPLATDTERHRVSMLVRLAPGGDYPPHTHGGVEELHLLHGELWIDGRKLYAGDYNRAEPGTGDQRVWSETGCTCVLMTSTGDILRAPAPAAAEPEDTYRTTVVRAAELAGGVVPLSHRLHMPVADLTRWLAGLDRPSMGTFLRIVDFLLEEGGKSGLDKDRKR